MDQVKARRPLQCLTNSSQRYDLCRVVVDVDETPISRDTKRHLGQIATEFQRERENIEALTRSIAEKEREQLKCEINRFESFLEKKMVRCHPSAGNCSNMIAIIYRKSWKSIILRF